MKIIFMTHSTDGEYNGDCDYAVIELTPALGELVAKRADLVEQAFQQDADLDEIYFWDGAAEYYDHRLLEACEEALAQAAEGRDPDRAVRDWLADLEQGGHAIMPEGIDLSDHEPQRTECTQMVVHRSPSVVPRPCEVFWTASPKHSDVYVSTSELPVTTLAAMLGTTGSPIS